MFLEKPYIPDREVKTVLADYRMQIEAEEMLGTMGIEVIRTCQCNDVYAAIDGHPDIMVHHLGGNQVVVAPNIYETLAHRFEKKGFAVTKGATWLHRNYPENIAYNIMRIGNIAFHHEKYTDPVIRDWFDKNNISLKHVNQGYTKCSVCIVDDHSIITADLKIAALAEKNDIDVLVISPGGISLPGMEYGFIGGATGLVSRDILVFTGHLENHKDKDKILEFIFKKGKRVIKLSEKQMFDMGSIIPLNY